MIDTKNLQLQIDALEKKVAELQETHTAEEIRRYHLRQAANIRLDQLEKQVSELRKRFKYHKHPAGAPRDLDAELKEALVPAPESVRIAGALNINAPPSPLAQDSDAQSKPLPLTELDVAWFVRVPGLEGIVFLYTKEQAKSFGHHYMVKWLSDTKDLTNPLAVVHESRSAIPSIVSYGLSDWPGLVRLDKWLQDNWTAINRYWDGTDEEPQLTKEPTPEAQTAEPTRPAESDAQSEPLKAPKLNWKPAGRGRYSVANTGSFTLEIDLHTSGILITRNDRIGDVPCVLLIGASLSGTLDLIRAQLEAESNLRVLLQRAADTLNCSVLEPKE